MIKYPLILALFFFCRTAVSAQQQASDSTDILIAAVKHNNKVVDSLRNLAVAQNQKLEDLKKKPATPAVKKELRKAEARFDSILVQLDSCTSVMERLNKEMEKKLAPTSRPRS
jgi:phage shock protein A